MKFVQRTCEWCKATRTVRATMPTGRFCSGRCRAAARWKRTGGWSPSSARHCANCGSEFMPRRERSRVCSSKCWWTHYYQTHPRPPVVLKTKPCLGCGRLFTPLHRNQQKYCEESCLVRSRDRKTVPKSTRRFVLKRDKWTCYLCHGSIPQDVRWPHPLSGTVDHVIPYSVCHHNRSDNLRATHWACNREKGDRLLGVEAGVSMEAA